MSFKSSYVLFYSDYFYTFSLCFRKSGIAEMYPVVLFWSLIHQVSLNSVCLAAILEGIGRFQRIVARCRFIPFRASLDAFLTSVSDWSGFWIGILIGCGNYASFSMVSRPAHFGPLLSIMSEFRIAVICMHGVLP